MLETKYNIIEDEWVEVNEPIESYDTGLNQFTYKIIGCCFDVYNELGKGFLEIVYKDALEYEFKKRNIVFEREKKYKIHYKDIILKHYYVADFVVENCVIFEVKAQSGIIEDHYKQVINYLAASKCDFALLVNFAENSLKYKRIILSKNKNSR